MAVAYYNQGQIWATWTSNGTTTTIPVTNYAQVWNTWTTSSSTTITGTWTNQTQQYVWNAWEGNRIGDGPVYRDELTQADVDALQARRERINRERLARAQQEQEDREAANIAAMTLLYDVLTPEERLAFEETDYLAVEGQDGRLYRIETHRDTVHGNIVRTDEHGCALARACVAPAMYDGGGHGVLPTADGWVGQYLGLRFDTVEFLSHANWSQIRGCREAAA